MLEVFFFLLETLFSEPIGTSLTEEVERFRLGNLHLKVSSGVDSDVLLKIGYVFKGFFRIQIQIKTGFKPFFSD